ncbi:peptidylprolyl isomerase [Breznakiella homolactica]|uniref:Peptidyl-prolyl cis-trans isomerase n=2 Tax=Breznakiella homolactica TaxID=2798577 RepID=A0A7T8BC74_9SPIR|nr:peptidylprolyl isomerase [Breznakiella homolactica]
MEITKDRVASFDYTLTDKENQVLDSSSGSGPLSYLHGHDNIIPGLEKVMEGKKEGDTFTVTVPAAEAYGERDERLVINVPLDRFEGAEVVEAGMQFEAETPEGNRIVTITRVADGMATVDANHPLAGTDLTFDVTVAAVRAATSEELEHGHPHIAGGCGDDCSCGDGDCGGGCSCGN